MSEGWQERRAEIDRLAETPATGTEEIRAAVDASWRHRPAPQECWCGATDHSLLHLAWLERWPGIYSGTKYSVNLDTEQDSL